MFFMTFPSQNLPVDVKANLHFGSAKQPVPKSSRPRGTKMQPQRRDNFGQIKFVACPDSTHLPFPCRNYVKRLPVAANYQFQV